MHCFLGLYGISVLKDKKIIAGTLIETPFNGQVNLPSGHKTCFLIFSFTHLSDFPLETQRPKLLILPKLETKK